MRCFRSGLLLLTVLIGTLAVEASVREQVCLNGVWKFSPGKIDQETLAPNAALYDVPVPSFWDRMEEFGIKPAWPADLARGWYRRTFTVNPAWRDRRIFLRFDAVRYVCEVFVNGKSMGSHNDGFIPFTTDVTDFIHFDKPNDLLVKVTNWKGLLYPDAKNIEFPLNQVIRSALAFNAPSGLPPRVGNQAGIWQDVWLQALPAVRIDQVKIATSVTNRKLNIRVWTAGTKPEGLKIRHEVLDGGKVVLTTEGPVGSSGETELKWPTPRLWWPHDPYLYQLRTQLVDGTGRITDEITTQFGFREIRIDGRNLQLNGQRLNLRADNYVQISDPAGMIAFRKEYIKALFEVMKLCNINAVRLHGSPSPASTLDAADETGMMILDESATYGSESHLRAEDPLFQKNNLRHIERWIRRDWNHPSVIAWSLANEFGAPVPHFQALYQLAKGLDATRIVYDNGEQVDAWCGHYTYHWAIDYQLPNTAYWFADPFRVLGKKSEEIRIPHFVDEFYNVDTTANTLAPSVFFGPRFSTASPGEKRNLHFWALRFVAEGARYTGLAEINPFCLLEHFWTFAAEGVRPVWPDPNAPGVKPTHPGPMMVNPGFSPGPKHPWTENYKDVQFAYSPMYAYTRQYAHTFWSEQIVRRRITCFNDDLRTLPKKVRWSVTVDGKPLSKGEHPVASKIGFYDEFDITFTLPKVIVRTEGVLNLSVDVDGKNVFENTVRLTVFPNAWKQADKVGLRQVLQVDQKSLENLGIVGRSVGSPEDLKGLKVLILGGEDTGSFYEALAKFVQSGGCVIALPQHDTDWMPGRLAMDRDSWLTIAFPNGNHPITAGMKEEDLRFWGEDHIVARGNFRLPELPETAKAIIVAGSSMGLAYAPLVEYPYGKGAYLLCQMPALSKGPAEGAAGTLMRNMVNYGLIRTYSSPAPAEPFVYRRMWELKIPLQDVLPAVPPNRHYLDPMAQVYGSNEPVLGWFPKEGFAEWKIAGIPNDVTEETLQLIVRTGDDGGPVRRPYQYSVFINGRPVAMQDKYQYERETFDSQQGWKILIGTISSAKPVKLRNGDRLRVTCHQAWAAIVQVKLKGEMK